MITSSVVDFKLSTPTGRLIGFDLGSKTIGIAVSDITRMISSPHSLIIKDKQTQTFAQILSIIKELNITGCVIGLPLNLNGEEGPRCQAVRQFTTDFQKFHDLPFLLWDERFSTSAVEKLMIRDDLSRKKRGLKIDKIAATYILQGALDACR